MMYSLRTFSIIALAFILLPGIKAQHSVGLLSYDFEKTFDGYNLIYPHNQPNVYLLNNCGEIVHTWPDAALQRPGNSVYLLENGDLLRASRHNVVTDDVIWAGGGGEFIEIRDWDNNLKWHFALNDSLQRIHHDIVMMPNGNILALTWDRKLRDEAIAAGRDTALLSKPDIWPEAVLEIRPVGDTFEIVWEWHVWDHMIQDFDSAKANFGIIADHPELVNINYGSNEGTASWMHANAIDYHPVLDEILISIPTFNEIWIIDHSTTTEEAAGHIGGLSGRGGDLMFRWGNPAVYDRGGQEDQTLFFQHNAHWVDAHLEPTHPHFGKIAVYNNRVAPDSSTVNILNPFFIDYGWMYGMNAEGEFLPDSFSWTYSHPEKTKMFSGGLSSVQLLPNNNTLIEVGNLGYAFEITSDNEIIWEYKVPLRMGSPVSQGEMLISNDNVTWRMHRYPIDYPAFEGRDLSPKGFIELSPDTTFCEIISGIDDVDENQFIVYPNPARSSFNVIRSTYAKAQLQLTDVYGRTVLTTELDDANEEIPIEKLPSGIYWVRIANYTVQPLMITH